MVADRVGVRRDAVDKKILKNRETTPLLVKLLPMGFKITGKRAGKKAVVKIMEQNWRIFEACFGDVAAVLNFQIVKQGELTQKLLAVQFGSKTESDAYTEVREIWPKIIINFVHSRSVCATVGGLEAALAGVAGQLDGVSHQLSGVESKVDGVSHQLSGVEGKVDGVGAKVDDVGAKVDGVGGAVGAMSKKVTFGNQLMKGMGGGIKRIEEHTASSAKKLDKLDKLETLEGQNDHILDYLKGIYSHLKKDDKAAKVSMAGSPPCQSPFDDDCVAKPEVGYDGGAERGGYDGGAERGFDGAESGGARLAELGGAFGGAERGAWNEFGCDSAEIGFGFGLEEFALVGLDSPERQVRDETKDEAPAPPPGSEEEHELAVAFPEGRVYEPAEEAAVKAPPASLAGIFDEANDEAKDEAPAPPPGSEEEHELAVAFPEGRVYEPAEEAAVKAPPPSEAPRGRGALKDANFLPAALFATKMIRHNEGRICDPKNVKPLTKATNAQILAAKPIVDARQQAAFGPSPEPSPEPSPAKRRYRPL